MAHFNTKEQTRNECFLAWDGVEEISKVECKINIDLQKYNLGQWHIWHSGRFQQLRTRVRIQLSAIFCKDIYLFTVNWWEDKNKEKEAANGLFKKMDFLLNEYVEKVLCFMELGEEDGTQERTKIDIFFLCVISTW